MKFILIAKNQLRRIENLIPQQWRPLNAYFRIIPHQPTLIVGMIDVVALIAELCRIGQDEKTVRKSSRNEKLLFVFSRKDNALPLAIRVAARAQIDGHIEHCTRNNSNQLRLRMVDLKMKSSQNTSRRSGLVILDKLHIYSSTRKIWRFVCLHKIAATIFIAFDVNDNHTINMSLVENEITGSNNFRIRHCSSNQSHDKTTLLPLSRIFRLSLFFRTKPPVLIASIPIDCSIQTCGKIGMHRLPSEFANKFIGVDRITPIMTRSIFHPIEIIGITAHAIEYRAKNLNVAFLSIGTD